MKVIIRTILVLLVMVMTNSVVYAESDPEHWDAKAVGVLRQMDDYTDSMGKFVINAESYLDASLGAGLIISNAGKTTISVDRSGSLHSITRSGSQVNEIFLHKGVLTVYSDEHKFFTRADVPEALNDGLMFALEEFAVETPVQDLLVLKSLESLVSKEADVIYVSGDSSIRGVDCHHVLISSPLVDMQVWIAKGDKPLPTRTLMTSKAVQGLPRHDAFQEWRATDGFEATEFQFEPPDGAREIGFINTP